MIAVIKLLALFMRQTVEVNLFGRRVDNNILVSGVGTQKDGYQGWWYSS